MPELPAGTVTFLFTDIEGSSQLWEQQPQAMAQALAQHHALLHEAIAAHSGEIFQTIGDAVCAAFPTAPAALEAALAAQRALRDAAWGATGPIRVRMALHSAAAAPAGGAYPSGPHFNRLARLLNAGHGGQLLLSLPTAGLLREQLPPAVDLCVLGVYRLRGLSLPEQIFQIVAADLPSEFPPLRRLEPQRATLPAHASPAVVGARELQPALEPAPKLRPYAAGEDTATALEAERRRLADLLRNEIAEPLTLLLAQANAYEQTLGSNPTARMAVSVLATLARQLLQQTRDLSERLRPGVLEDLGLEPALEALASQAMRAHGLQVSLQIERLRERPPRAIELALFRAAQDVFDRIARATHARQISIRLARMNERLELSIADDGDPAAGLEALERARWQITRLGGDFATASGPHGGLAITIGMQIQPPVELTTREIEVLQLLAQGRSNKQIAQALSISPRTVNFHLDNIYAKLGVVSRTEAAIYALRYA